MSTAAPSDPGAPPLTLAIEIANPASNDGAGGSVALASHTPFVLLAEEPVHAATFEQDDLLPAIERMMNGTDVARARIGTVAVSIGPGGFTSTRIACAAGKMIAEALRARCRGVPSALVAFADADRARAPAGRPVAVALASKAGTAWVAVFDEGEATEAHAAAARDGRIVTGDELAALGPGLVLADGHLDGAIRSALVAAGVPIEMPRFSAGTLARVSTLVPAINGGLLVPIYPREPEAVTLWRKRGSGKA